MGTTSRKVSPRNSKIVLEFGSKLKINIMYFNEVGLKKYYVSISVMQRLWMLFQIQEEARLEFKVLNERDMSKKSGTDRVYTTKGGKRKMVDDEDVISGFKFGTSIIPFSGLTHEWWFLRQFEIHFFFQRRTKRLLSTNQDPNAWKFYTFASRSTSTTCSVETTLSTCLPNKMTK